MVAFATHQALLVDKSACTTHTVLRIPLNWCCRKSSTPTNRRHQFLRSCQTSPSPAPPPSHSTTSSKPSAVPASPLCSLLNILTSLFPVWVTLAAIAAFFNPPSFLWFTTPFILPTLSLIMLGMGLTIPASTFLSLLSKPPPLLLGALCQYTIMPLLSTILSSLLKLPPPFAVGLILVGVCPGGAASNLICLIAQADVALSVMLTLVSTLLSVIMIPFLMQTLAGTLVPVSALALFRSAAQIVLVPLAVGAILKSRFPALVRRVLQVLPLVSVFGVALICGGCVAANASALAVVGGRLVLAVALLHATGGLLGYVIARLSGMSLQAARTVSIEVMMQNSTMAVSLANLHFANPLTAVPGAISAVTHSIFGSILAGVWRLLDSVHAARKADIEKPHVPTETCLKD